MKFRLLGLSVFAFLSCFTFVAPTAFAVEEVKVVYQYAGNHGVDLSNFRGSFKINAFTDDRAGVDANLITDKDLGNSNASGGYQADSAITALIQQAFEQGFASGGTELVDADASMSLSGKLLSTEAQIVERGGEQMIQLTLRVNVQLQKDGRNAWQITLFGRGRVPVADGMAASVQAALDRMVTELVIDDYFLQEVR